MTAGEDRRPAVVVGAGPVGLTAALALRGLGVPALVLEAGPADRLRAGSRAIYMHSATLDVLGRLSPGLVEDLVTHGLVWRTQRTYFRGREVYARSYAPPPPGTLPHFTCLPQVETERYLLRAAKDAGVQFAWDQRVVEATAGPDGVDLVTEAGDRWKARYVIAADGGRSAVRESVGVRMEGSRSEGWYVVVDAEEDPADPLPVERVFHYQHPAVGGRNVLLVPFAGHWRIDLQCHDEDDPEAFSGAEGVRRWLPKVMPAKYADRVSWVSTYRFLQVVADDFADAQRRVLLAGEAGHLFAPFGARGLNSGVPDADAAAAAVHTALDAGTPARARAAVEEFARSRRAAAMFNRAAAGAALAHLRPDPLLRTRIQVAAALSPLHERFGRWLETAPYGPRGAPPTSHLYRY